MCAAPLLDPLHVFRAAEVVAVFRFTQPTRLPGALAGQLTCRGGAILLATPIPVIGHKQHPTMQAFTTTRFGLHEVQTSSLKTQAGERQARSKSVREENAKRRE